jgi:hypothetical protein
MFIASADSASTTEIRFSDPPVKMSASQGKDDLTINLEFRFAIKLIQLLYNGYKEFEFKISEPTPDSKFPYFGGNDGDIREIEDIIANWANEQIEYSGMSDSEYETYFYQKYSILNFIPDSMVAEYNSAIVKSRDLGKSFNYKNFQRQYSFLRRTSVDEPAQSLKFWTQPSNKSESVLYEMNVGEHSQCPGMIGDAEFPRGITNKSFEGETTSAPEGKIKFGSENFKVEFWEYWSKFINSNSEKEKLLEFKDSVTDFYPCKINAEMKFESKEEMIAFTGMMIQDTLSIDLNFISETHPKKLRCETTEISLQDACARLAATQKPLEVSITPGEGDTVEDLITVYNPNKSSVFMYVELKGWDDKLANNVSGDEYYQMIAAKTTATFTVDASVNYSNRYYQGLGLSGLWYEFLKGNKNEDVLNAIQIPFSTRVPGVYGVIKPNQADPVITYALDSENNRWMFFVSKIPPYIDEIKYYIRPFVQKGFAAQRAPGISRSLQKHGWIRFQVDPGIGNERASSPTSIASIPSPGLFEETYYEVAADLIRNSDVVDTISCNFKNPRRLAISSYVNSSLEVIGTQNSGYDKIIMAAQISSTAPSIITDIIGNTPFSSEYLETFDSTKAESTIVCFFKVSRINLDTGTVEEMGWHAPNTPVQIPLGGEATKNRLYNAKLYALPIGAVLSKNAPTATSPPWAGGGGGSQNYHQNYAKFNSAYYERHSTYPKLRYSSVDFTAASLDSFTGTSHTAKVSSPGKNKPSLLSFDVEFDELRKVNMLNWTIDEGGNSDQPDYFLITGTYGGITAPVAWCPAIQYVPRYCVTDTNLSSALGLVVYSLTAVFGTGEVQQYSTQARMLRTSNENERLVGV